MHQCFFNLQRRLQPMAQNWHPRGAGKIRHPAGGPGAVALEREWAGVRLLLHVPLVPDAQLPSDGWSVAVGDNKAEKRAHLQGQE